MRRRLLICAALAAATFAAFHQVGGHDFLSYDDRGYVTENPHVLEGLDADSLRWALGAFEKGNWHPLTWWSHMADQQFFGTAPAGHHWVNLILHVANALLLFVVLDRMTAAPWRSAFVAALFALHPLHVESVAWIAERKDVLSALFWMLTLLAYVRYVERPGRARYVVLLGCFALGLMAKPMLVTLPFVLLLLDYWPLDRLPASRRELSRLLLEKAPLLLLAAASSVVTLVAQQRVGAVGSIEALPISLRVGNALSAYAGYLAKTFWPAGLSVIYVLRPTLGSAEVLLSGLILASITAGVVLTARRRPYLAVGWLWYVGTLVPVIGLVQVGRQAMADRYTYIPSIGIFVMVAWGVPALFSGRRHRAGLLAAAAAVVVCALTIATRHQLGYWKDSVTLFSRAVELDADNDVAHRQLGLVMMEQGRNEEALHHYSEALRVIPGHPSALTGKGILLAMQGRTAEAIALFTRALEADPDYAQAHYNLGNALAWQGRGGEAIPHYAAALELEPDRVEIRVNLAHALLEAGRLDEALSHLGEAVRLDPASFEPRYNLAIALAESGRPDDAIAEFLELVARHDVPEAHHGLGIALMQRGRLDEAIDQFEIAVRQGPTVPEFKRSLDAALRLAEAPPGRSP